MEDGNAGLDASSQESVDESVVIVDSLFVDRIASTTQGDDSAPRDGESVMRCAVCLQEIYVLLVEMIAVDCVVS